MKINLISLYKKVKTQLQELATRFLHFFKGKNKKRKLLATGLITVALGIGLFYWVFLKDLPSPKALSQPTQYTTTIQGRRGETLYNIYLEKNRLPIELDQLPDSVKQATLAIEDKEFYQHHGFSARGIIRAAFKTIIKRDLQGGSTITQQLVKNALLTPERTIKRKIKEAILTLAAEVIYSKDQILEMYFNQTPYGGTTWGIEAAARYYFDKSSYELTLAESALLAGLPASPTTYSPFGTRPEKAKNRQELVLSKMVEADFISQEEADAAKEEELQYTQIKDPIQAPHFSMYVKENLIELFGQKKVEQGGLEVKTTLDLALQKTAEEVVAEEIEKVQQYNISNGAALITNPQTGEILAMAGSRDYFDQEIDGNFNVATARRQPGSSIKPLNYAVALEEGKITAATPLLDLPTCFYQEGTKTYCPTNYDHSYHDITQARFALASSYNVPAVKVLALNSLETFIDYAGKFGITTFNDPSRFGLSLTLGGGEVRMTDMATAFGTLANLGVKKDLTAILKVTDKKGNVLLNRERNLGAIGERAISKEAAYITTHILLDNGARAAAFGYRSALYLPDHPEVAVKTGTTNDMRDNWTIGYTPKRLVAVWVGNNDNSPMNRVTSGITGASPIWHNIMNDVLAEEDQQTWPPKPEGVVGLSVCSDSGKRPGDSGCPTRFEYFIKDQLPSEQGDFREQILINKANGSPVQPGQEPEEVEEQEHPVVRGPLGAIFCLDCPAPQEPAYFRYPLRK